MLTTLPLNRILPALHNPRGEVDPATVTGLAASVRAIGVISPITVSPDPESPGCYRIQAGSRRVAAARMAGLAEINAVVREGVPASLALAENMLRADLTPIEEGEAIRKLLDQRRTAREIAAHLGRPVGFVLRRSLLTAILPELRRIAEERRWTIDMLELVAAYPAETQSALLNKPWLRSRGDLVEELARVTHQLLLAPFDVACETLVPAAGSCLACPRRTGAMPDLFGDIEEELAQDDRCLDAGCWLGKVNAHVTARLAEAPAGAITISRAYGTKGAQLSHYEYEEADETTEGAVPAIVVGDVPEAGKVLYIVPDRPPRTLASEGAEAPPEKKTVTLEEKRRNLEKRRAAHVLLRMAKALREGEAQIDTLDRAAALTAVFGTYHNLIPNHNQTQDKHPWKTAEKRAKEQPENIALGLFGAVRETLARRFEWLAKNEASLDEARGGCQYLGLPFRAYKAAADEAIREPKSWAAADAEAGK